MPTNQPAGRAARPTWRCACPPGGRSSGGPAAGRHPLPCVRPAVTHPACRRACNPCQPAARRALGGVRARRPGPRVRPAGCASTWRQANVRLRVDIFNAVAAMLRTGIGVGILPTFMASAPPRAGGGVRAHPRAERAGVDADPPRPAPDRAGARLHAARGRRRGRAPGAGRGRRLTRGAVALRLRRAAAAPPAPRGSAGAAARRPPPGRCRSSRRCRSCRWPGTPGRPARPPGSRRPGG
jgi:hypothetical protein